MVKLVSKIVIASAFVFVSVFAGHSLFSQNENVKGNHVRFFGPRNISAGDFESLYQAKFYHPDGLKAPKRNTSFGINATQILKDLKARNYDAILRYVSNDVVLSLTGGTKAELKQTIEQFRNDYEAVKGQKGLNDSLLGQWQKIVSRLEVRNFGPKYPNVLIYKTENNEFARLAFAIKKKNNRWRITKILKLSSNGTVAPFIGNKGGEVARAKFKKAKRRLSDHYRTRRLKQ